MKEAVASQEVFAVSFKPHANSKNLASPDKILVGLVDIPPTGMTTVYEMDRHDKKDSSAWRFTQQDFIDAGVGSIVTNFIESHPGLTIPTYSTKVAKSVMCTPTKPCSHCVAARAAAMMRSP